MVEALVEQVAWLTPTSLFVLLNIVIATILLSTSFHGHSKKSHQDPHNDDNSLYATRPRAQPPPPLARTPSLFSRVTSFNLSNYYPYNTTGDTERYYPDEQSEQRQYQYQQQSDPSPTLFSRVASFKFLGRNTDEQPDLKPEGQGFKEPVPEPAVQSPMKRDNNNNNHNNIVNRVQQVGQEASVSTVPRAPSLLSRVRSFNFSGVRREAEEEARERDDQEIVVEKKVKKKNKTTSLPRETTTSKVDEEVDNKADDFINRFKQQLKLQRIDSLIRQRRG